MMLTHTWLDQYVGTPMHALLQPAVASAIQFDGGEIDSIPIGHKGSFAEARPPFAVVLLQFSMPPDDPTSHTLTLLTETGESTYSIVCAQRRRSDKVWMTLVPRAIFKHEDGTLTYLRAEDATLAENDEAVLYHYSAMLNLFYVMGCSNVTFSDNPAPLALNKKRIKTGKTPLFEYKTLVIKAPSTRVIGQDRGGSHASPRVHLRRGHIRLLSNEKKVWVQPCVVGSKTGVVSKDYRVVPA